MSRVLKYFAVLLLLVCSLAKAQMTYTGTTTDDSFLATGSPQNPKGTDLTGDNFGAAGVLAVAPAASLEGEFQSVLKFDLSGATNLFITSYGTNWIISAVSLDFAGNFATQGAQPDNGIFNTVNTGNFVIEWMTDDNWTEGTGRPMSPTTDGVTYDSLSTLLAGTHEPLCTNTYIPPGDNVHVIWPLPLNAGLVTNILAGGPVSFRLYAADDQVSYLFNSHNFGNGNQPLIHVTAIPLPVLLSGGITNGVFCLNGIGHDYVIYSVQACANLSTASWQTIATTIANGTGVIQFNNTNLPNQPRQFYRLSQ